MVGKYITERELDFFDFTIALLIICCLFSTTRVPEGLAKQGWIARIKPTSSLPPFTAASGPRDKTKMTAPIEVFEFFFNEGFFKLLQTDAQPTSADPRNTLDITEKSIAGLIAVELGMGMVGLHRQKDYWADEDRTFGLFPSAFFRQFFSRKEFEETKRRVKVDRSKGSHWVNTISEKFWIPGQYVSTPYCGADLSYRLNDRKIAVDEGILPGHHDDPSKSWVPGKPNPNGYEYLIMVDELGFLVFIIWEKPHFNMKYTRPKTMKEVMQVMAEQLAKISKIANISLQPFIFYLDSRFTSIDAMQHLKSLGFYTVMSCGSMMAPRFLGQFMSGILKKKAKNGYKVDGKNYLYPDTIPDKMKIRQWRAVYNTKLDAYFIVLQAKKSTVLYLLTNYGSPAGVKTMHRRRKYPKARYWVWAPQAQGEYNAYKNLVDNYNRALLTYMPRNLTKTAQKKYVIIDS